MYAIFLSPVLLVFLVISSLAHINISFFIKRSTSVTANITALQTAAALIGRIGLA